MSVIHALTSLLIRQLHAHIVVPFAGCDVQASKPVLILDGWIALECNQGVHSLEHIQLDGQMERTVLTDVLVLLGVRVSVIL